MILDGTSPDKRELRSVVASGAEPCSRLEADRPARRPSPGGSAWSYDPLMPHSWHHPLTPVMDRVVKLDPCCVMDIGIGYGKWGFLVREALDWASGRLERESWAVRIYGIEVFPYESPLHDWVYDRVTRADVLDVQGDISGFELVMINDVIEHIDKPQAMDLLRGLVARNRNVIVSTPLEFFGQEIADNEHEHHISHWTMDDFAEFTYDYEVAGNAAMVVTLAGSGASWPTLREKWASNVYRVPVLRRRPALVIPAKRLANRVSRVRLSIRSA